MASLMEIMQLCRLCLVKDQVNIPIFEEQGDIRQIFLKISACLPVKVSREDNLPKKICDGCSYKLEILYQFWNTSANSEKQLLKWLSQVGAEKSPTSDKVAVAPVQPHSMPSDGVILKQEVVDLADSHSADEIAPDDLNVSSDAQDYILQQQQLPYQPIAFQFPQDGFAEGEGATNASGPSATVTSEAAEAAPPKRKRRAAAMKALPPQIDSEEEDEDDVDMVETKIAKTEEQTDESGGEDPEPTAFVGVPSTSTDNEQPGPSGVGKGSAEAPYLDHNYSSDIYEIVQEDQENPDSKKRRLKCAHCYKVFESMTKFKAHIRNHREKTFACDLCDKKFVFQYQVGNHKQAVHSTERTCICNICGTGFATKSYLKSHERIHSNAHKFKCDKCGRGYYNRNAFTHHYEVHHKGTRYQCDQCDKSFMDEYYYKKHLQSHDPSFVQKKFQCELCNKVLHYFRTYINHMKTHNGENRHICEICGKVFGWAQSLKDHMRLHKGEKPFICETCGKRFSKRQSLVVHERIHTKAKPYSCNLCDKRFSQRGSLKIHVRYHTGERPFKCQICGKMFITSTLLKVHSKVHGTPLK